MITLLSLFACTGPSSEEAWPVLGQVPSFSLTDGQNATVTDQTLRGKVWVADFIFTSCPDVCPVLQTHMAEVQAHYAKEDRVRLVSFSVDPGTDTPPVLAAYGARFGADPAKWLHLTGPIGDIKTVVVSGFKIAMERVSQEGEPSRVLHGERFVVVDEEGRIRGYPDPKELGKGALYANVDALLND
jgi:protein SCO1/2